MLANCHTCAKARSRAGFFVPVYKPLARLLGGPFLFLVAALDDESMDMNTITQELFARLGRIEEKLDRVVRLEERQDRNERDVADVVERVGELEDVVQQQASQLDSLTTTSTHRWGTFAKVFFGILGFFGLVSAPLITEAVMIKLGIK